MALGVAEDLSCAVNLETTGVLYPRSPELKESLESSKVSTVSPVPASEQLSVVECVGDMGEADYESLPTNSLWLHLMAGAMAGVMEHCCMYPVDCVKVLHYVHQQSLRQVYIMCSVLIL